MQRFPVKNQGWTLIEVAVVTIIVGIMAAIATPSMVGMKARSDLKDAMGQVKGALQEAQRAAIKRGSSCPVTVTLGNTGGVTSSTVGCISSPVSFSSGQDIRLVDASSTASTTASINFSYKGTVTLASALTLLIQSKNNFTPTQKCLVLSQPLGLIRTGEYNGSDCESQF